MFKGKKSYFENVGLKTIYLDAKKISLEEIMETNMKVLTFSEGEV